MKCNICGQEKEKGKTNTFGKFTSFVCEECGQGLFDILPDERSKYTCVGGVCNLKEHRV